jgi:hypothetical protein
VPRLPFGLADPQLPATSGRRGGTVGVPVVQEPGIDSDAATLPGRALGDLGTQVAQAGQYLQQAEAYQFQRQRAQDVLDSKTELQETRQLLLTKYDELLQGDYRTLPEDVLKEGNRIIQERGRHLSPQARALFTEDAKQALTVLQQNALGERTKRRDQNTAYTMSREIQQVQALMLRTTTPYEQEVVLGQFDDLAAQFVSTGLVRGEVMATMRQKTLDAVADQRVQQMIQAYPDAMQQNLYAQLTNQPTREDLPQARPESLAELHQQAKTMSKARFAEQEHKERYQAYQLSEQQRQNSRELVTQLYTTPLTPASVPKFQEILTQAAAGLKSGVLDERMGEHIMNTAQAHMQTASKPPVFRDDPETEYTLSLAIRMAERPEQFAQARDMLTSQARGRLKPETFGQLYDKLEQREAASNWRHFPEVRAAKDILVRGAMVPYGGTLAGQMKPMMQQKLTWAIDAWEAQLQQMFDDPQQGPRQVKQLAEAFAWENRRQMLQPDINNEADAQEYLPPQIQRATTPVELAQEIHALRMLGWSNGSLLIIRDNWHRWRDSWSRGADGLPMPPRQSQSGGGQRPVSPSGSSGTRNPYQLPGEAPAQQQGRRSN